MSLFASLWAASSTVAFPDQTEFGDMTQATQEKTQASQALTEAEKILQGKVKLLLALSISDTEQKRGEATSTSVPSGVRASALLNSLIEDYLVESRKEGRTEMVKIGEKGREFLQSAIASPELRFTPRQSLNGKWLNQLLEVIREKSGQSSSNNGNESLAEKNGNASALSITSYEAFEELVLETYDRLNQDYNLGDLVPIYRMRREIGDRVSRNHFNDWLLEVQANDLFQLMSGELPSATPDQMEDSLEIPGTRIRVYARKL